MPAIRSSAKPGQTYVLIVPVTFEGKAILSATFRRPGLREIAAFTRAASAVEGQSAPRHAARLVTLVTNLSEPQVRCLAGRDLLVLAEKANAILAGLLPAKGGRLH